jgi:hypothetical protein
VKFWKRPHLDKRWRSSKISTTFFHSSNVEGQVLINLLIHKFYKCYKNKLEAKDKYQSVFWFTSFDNAETRQNQTSATKDKLDAICCIFDQFSQACTKNYSTGWNLTVDKGLNTYRGRSPFTVYIKSKSGQ